jgi:hypothetical protein
MALTLVIGRSTISTWALTLFNWAPALMTPRLAGKVTNSNQPENRS